MGVRETIEVRQTLYPYQASTHADPIYESPGGNRFLVVTIRGDLERNGNWVEFFTGPTDSLDAVASSRFVAQLFTRSKSENPLRTRPVKWLRGGRSVAFLWKHDDDARQVMVLDLETGTRRQITNSATDITEFDIDPTGLICLYAADPKLSDQKSLQMRRDGFVVEHQSIEALLRGQLDGEEAWASPQFFLQTTSTPELRRIPLSDRRTEVRPEIVMSPTGLHAIVSAPPKYVSADWSVYDQSSPHLVGYRELAAHMEAPTAISQYWVVDLRRGTARPLLDAPRNRAPRRIVWAPDGTRVLVGPTYTPPLSSSVTGRRGGALLVVGLRGDYEELPTPPALLAQLPKLSWRGANEVVVGSGDDEVSFVFASGQWQQQILSPATPSINNRIKVTLSDGLNSPPRLRAIDLRSQKAVELLDLHDAIRGRTLADVKLVHWEDSQGRHWTGTLYSPIKPLRTKIPLVIQLAGAPLPRENFSLLGSDLPTGYAAQPLANRGMAVLNMYRPDAGFGSAEMTPGEPITVMEGVESAIRWLTTSENIDPLRVGLFGFSRAGWYAQYILTHSHLTYAAANINDNLDASYFQYILQSYGARAEVDQDVGAEPIQAGLHQWLAHAPGFRTDLIRAPLRLERDQGGRGPLISALYSWETFSRMRQRGQPVELYFIPDIDAGEHNLEGPRQQFASRSGTVDWFDFWLNDHEDEDIAKVDQYARWRSLRKLQAKPTTQVISDSIQLVR